MKFLINNTEYDPVAGMKHVTLQTLYELKARYGIGVKSLKAIAQKMDAMDDVSDVLEDPESFQVLLVMIWLARRYAGERLTLEQANDDFGIVDMKIIHEEGDDELAEQSRPKAPTGSGQGAKSSKRKASKI